MKQLILAISIIMTTSIVEAEDRIILMPSDYADYSYSEQQAFVASDIHQMRDETYSEAVVRDAFMQDNLELQGIDLEEWE